MGGGGGGEVRKLVFYAQSTSTVISGRWWGRGGGGRGREEDRVIKTHINCFRTGYSGGNAGGSHSGEGGTTTDSTSVGAVYGDFRNPATVGSGGRLTRPGGALDIEAIKVIINGQLLAK